MAISQDEQMIYLGALLQDPLQRLDISREIAQYNSFLNVGLPLIVKTMFNSTMTVVNERALTEMDRNITAFTISIGYSSVSLERPTQIDREGFEVPRNPDDYRVNDGFYSADMILTSDISIVATNASGDIVGNIRSSVQNIRVSAVPIMIKSSHCNTCGAPDEMLEGICEDPMDPGGYFVVMGKEYFVNTNENLAYNKPLIFKSTLKGEKVRAIVISQRGGAFEHSTMLEMMYSSDGALYIKVQAATFTRDRLPFYHIFRVLGVTEDEAIAALVIYDMEDKGRVSGKMMELLVGAFLAKYPKYEAMATSILPVDAMLQMHEMTTNAENPTKYRSSENATRFAAQSTLDVLDNNLLPHIGIGSDPDTRYKKLLFIGSLIRDILLVVMDLREEDDRDHMANKRAHGAGMNMSKAFKTLFNSKVHNPISNMLIKEVQNKSFDLISVQELTTSIRTNISRDDLQTAFERCITAVKESQVREKVRMSGQPLERKNRMNVLCSLRSVITSVTKVPKNTKRSDRLRYWHTSSDGIYCPAHTSESEKIGTVKQLAITAIISGYNEGLSPVLKERIMKDPSLIPVVDLELARIPRENLTKVMVDGDWLGCTKDPHLFVARYRKLRREGVLDKFTSIEWGSVTNQIAFFTDLGRFMRPLLIVDNNLEDYDAGKAEFSQSVRLTREMIARLRGGSMTFADLVTEGVVEYIYPGEEILLCPSLQMLEETKGDVTSRWTHCNMEHALFGITVLMSPYIDRNEPLRNTLVTIHAKQACGQPFSNVRTTTRLNQYFNMYRVHTPTVKTLMSHIVPPASQTLIVLYGIFLGYNQEDSSMVNKASQEMGMLKGSYYKTIQIDIDKTMTIRVPSAKDTSLFRHNMSYAKLDEDGFIPVGTLVKKNDVILGVVVELADEREGKRFIDKSESYTNEDDGRVITVIKKLDGMKKFVSITFEYVRSLTVGDKMTSRAGNKNVNGLLVPRADMPHTADGMRPDVIINPHSIPSRMTYAQLFETAAQRVCAKKGIILDGTVYRKLDVRELLEDMEKSGVGVRERMTNGITGETFDALLFAGPQCVLRLPKFVVEDRHAVGRQGPINPLTAQAITGKRVQGGHKVGELETWVFLAQGTMSVFFEEFYLDSDARKMYVCRGCNEPAIYNEEKSVYRCKICSDKADIAEVASCKTTMLVLHEWAVANINVKLVPEPRKFEVAAPAQ